MSMSLLDMLNEVTRHSMMTKEEFGKIMHDPESTESEKRMALKALEDAEGYENLADD